MKYLLQYTNKIKTSTLFSEISLFYRLESETLKDKISEVILKAGMTFAVDGKQYITIAAGNVVYTFGLRD